MKHGARLAQRAHLFDLIAGKTEAPANLFRHLGSDFGMLVETDAVGRAPERRGFAHVVQQRSERESLGAACGQAFEQHERVGPHITFRMELWRLLHALHLFDLGYHLVKQARLVQQLEGAARLAFSEHFENLVADALAADLMNLRGQFPDSSEGPWLDFVAEPGGEAHRAQQT